MLSEFSQKGKGRSEERSLLVRMRKEKVGEEDVVIPSIEVLACSALHPARIRLGEGAGPGPPLAGLLVCSGTLSREFPAFLAFSSRAWLS